MIKFGRRWEKIILKKSNKFTHVIVYLQLKFNKIVQTLTNFIAREV